MTACAAFEDRLLDHAELSPEERVDVDEHLKGCATCREYLDLLQEIDATLTAEVHRVRLNPQHVANVRRLKTAAAPIGPVSPMPEWLDLVAAGALFVFAGGMAWQAGLFVYVFAAVRAWI
jgi:anti-sigma factor RsiW